MNRDIITINIKNKTQYAKAYYASDKTAATISTDMDQFPYTRWYRGATMSSTPVIMEREAGYAVVHKNDKPEKQKGTYPNHVFTTPCSTVLPTYSKEEKDKKITASQYCSDKFL
jgi:hypothetical protein